jgi:hypothetical protein
MSYTLGQASKATGISKPTLSRAIKSGRISAKRQEDGSFLIDPSELHRVYPPVNANRNDNGEMKQSETLGNPESLRAQLEILKEERDRERQQLQATIDDLRGERDRLLKVIDEQAGTVKQLTHQPERQEPAATPETTPMEHPSGRPLAVRAGFGVALVLALLALAGALYVSPWWPK